MVEAFLQERREESAVDEKCERHLMTQNPSGYFTQTTVICLNGDLDNLARIRIFHLPRVASAGIFDCCGLLLPDLSGTGADFCSRGRFISSAVCLSHNPER